MLSTGDATLVVGVALAVGLLAAVSSVVVRRRRPRPPGPAQAPASASAEITVVPSRRRAAVIYNPLKVPDLEEMIERVRVYMDGIGWDEPTWLATTVDDPGVGMCQLAVRDECDVVFVCGGDGTVMAGVSALAGCDVPLAILPMGTGNLLARNLDLPLDDEEECLRIGTSGRTRAIDVGAIEDRRFAVMAGIGFDAAIMRDARDGLKRVLGWPAYVVSGAKHLRGRGVRVSITVDEEEPMQRRVRTVVVGNVGRLQGNIPLLPDAVADDGWLDVVVFSPRHVLDWARVAGRVLGRTRSRDQRMERFRVRRVRVEAVTPQPRQLDGDVIDDSTTLDVHIEPRALKVRVA